MSSLHGSSLEVQLLELSNKPNFKIYSSTLRNASSEITFLKNELRQAEELIAGLKGLDIVNEGIIKRF